MAAGGTIGQHLSYLATMAVLSRLLAPSDFGVVALLGSINGFFQIFAQGGLSSAMIQRKEFSANDDRAVVGLALLIGIVLAGVLYLVAPLLATLFEKDDLSAVIRTACIAMVLLPLGQTANGILARRQQFARRGIVGVGATLVAGIAAIALALHGFGYWSLVFQVVARPFLVACFAWGFVRSVPLPRWDRSVVRQVWGFSGFIILFQVVNYWSRQSDNLLIGKFLGLEALGYYSRAYALLLVPLTLLSGVLSPVLHSALREGENSIAVIADRWLESVRMIGMVSMPMMAVASISAGWIVPFAWGVNFEPAVNTFAILAIAGMHQPMLSIGGAVFFTLERNRLLFILGLVSAIIYISGFVAGLRFGIEGVAWGFVVASHMVFLMSFHIILTSVLKSSWRRAARYFRGPVLVTIPAVAIALGLRECSGCLFGPDGFRLMVVFGLSGLGAVLTGVLVEPWLRTRVLGMARSRLMPLGNRQGKDSG